MSVSAFSKVPPRNNDNTDTGPRSWAGSLIEGSRDASGMLFRRNRYVDPASGRFTQEDPIGLAGGMNLYGFAAGDPVSYRDPYGLEAEESDILLQGRLGIATKIARAVSSALARRAARAAMRRAARTVDDLEEGLRASGGAVRGMRPPPHPATSASRNDFGENVIKWGGGHAEARARIGTLTREELERGGVTREMAQQWRDFYVNEAVLRPTNPSARGRAELMHRAVELLQ